ncbi:DUF859 family phage minor structural protein [Granulicatella sp. WM01]|uniref:DUF859 family phage minor structural protein n=1 Tax=unclassified Granulicatella TaxID=2630493 RepID=UPI00210FB55A|nr:DUF859 family phage minor structural protein [Granulicatella sp. WM01]
MNNLTLRVEYYYTSQNISNNTSEVTYQAWLDASGFRYWNLYNNSNLTITIDGQVVHNANHSYDTNASNPFNLHTGTHRVWHHSDGNKSSHISVSFDTQTRGVMRLEGTLHLPTIPRAADAVQLTSATRYIDSAKTATFNVKSASFYNHLKVLQGGTHIKGIRLGQQSQGNVHVPVTLSSSELSTIYNRNTQTDGVTLEFVLESFSDSSYGTKIGESGALSAWYVFPEGLTPAIDSLEITELNTNVANVISSGHYVNLLSTIRVRMVNARGTYGSSIRNSYVQVGNIRRNGTSVDINGDVGSGTVTVTATISDSRGRSASRSTTIQVLEYYRPRIQAFLPARTGNGTNKAVLANVIASVKPVYINNTNRNTYRVVVERSERNHNIWQKMYDATGTVEHITQTLSCGNDYDQAKAYDVRLTIHDAFNQQQQAIATISTITVVMAWGRNNVGIGKIPTDGRTLDIEGNVHTSHKYYVDNKPIQHYQLTNDEGAIKFTDKSINDIRETGFYFVKTDNPAQSTAYGLLSVFYTGGKEAMQDYKTYDGSRHFSRCSSYSTGEWSNWVELATVSYPRWISTGVSNVFYKVVGHTVHVRGGVKSVSGGTFSVGSVPSQYVPQRLMFVVAEWSTNGDRNVHLQVNGTGEMSILNSIAGMAYWFDISFGIQ